MTRKLALFIALAVVLAGVFVRLGVWQLRRLEQRRARNATVLARLDEPVVPFEQLRDTASFRRASLEGAPDFDREIVYTGRSRNGSPGVYIITPVRRPGSDTAVLVIRGWVYSPDAATVELAPWREQRTSFSGYVSAIPARSARPSSAVVGRRIRAFTRANVQSLLPYPVAELYLVSQDSAGTSAPARLTRPALDDGPHLSYAIQWFAFAAIAIGGAGIVGFRARDTNHTGSTAA